MEWWSAIGLILCLLVMALFLYGMSSGVIAFMKRIDALEKHLGGE